MRRDDHGTRRPTSRDVALAAGVSVAVVSYAFNRPDRVAPATRERVLAAAAALGYRGPDPAARALRLGRRGAVALVGARPVEDLLGDPALALVARGLAHACDRAGVSLLLSARSEVDADGVVLVRAGRAAPPAGRPAVVVDGPPLDGWPSVEADLERGAAAVAAHLAERGRRRLAVIAWPDAGPRLEGAHRGWGARGALSGYRATGTAREEGEAAARIALRERPRPDAILALTDRLALGALDAARNLGLDVPRDLAVAGIDDLPEARAAGLTTVFVPYRPMGDLAGTMLAALLAGEQPPAPTAPLPTELTIRATTATGSARPNPR